MQKLILFCAVFFTIAACSKKTVDNDPVLYQAKLSDYVGLWKVDIIDTDPVMPYQGSANFNLTIQDLHNFTITFPKGRGNPNKDTTINGTWEFDRGSAGFKATYMDRTDRIQLYSGLIYKNDKGGLYFYAPEYSIFVMHSNGGSSWGSIKGNKE